MAWKMHGNGKHRLTLDVHISKMFAVLLGILFILELAGGIAGYVLRDELDKIVRANALEGMLHYENTTELNLVTKAWDQMQVNYECCGVSDYTDWQNNTMFQGEYSVPLSCCRVDECKGIIRDTPPDLLDRWIWTNGCADLLGQYAEQKVGEISGIICGIAVIQILGISLACCLSKSILKDYEDYYY